MNNINLEKYFISKKIFHKKQANISFEDKIVHLTELQYIGLEMKKASKRKIKSYEMVWKIS